MEKVRALEIKKRALAAIVELTAALKDCERVANKAEYAKLKKSIGLAIGAIEMHVNVPLYQQYPELEDNKGDQISHEPQP
jgi:hypothetical protein